MDFILPHQDSQGEVLTGHEHENGLKYAFTKTPQNARLAIDL